MPWYFLLGVVTGMRTMTAVAVLCWCAWLGLLPLHGWAFWAANLVSVVVFTLLALGEYVGDTRANAPDRISAGPLAARIAFATLAGALAANALYEPLAGGILFAIVGALLGAYGGYRARRACTRMCRRDLPVALLESAIALLLALAAASRLHHDLYTPNSAFNQLQRLVHSLAG